MSTRYTIPIQPLAIITLLFLSVLWFPVYGQNQDMDQAPHTDSARQSRVNLHFQTTYIYQYKPSFSASYSGQHSLSKEEEKQNSLTGTMFFGARLWHGAEVYINPEIAGGSGLSGASGMGASTNGETFRVGDPSPTLYLARAYLKQTFALNKKAIVAGDGFNQLQTNYTTRTLAFYLGKLCLGDIFDINNCAGGPRTSFMNWCLMNNGAWDYAANVRGYTFCFATALQWDNMTYKAALAALPTVANGAKLSTDLAKEYSINAEVTRAHKLRNKDGHLRLLGYCNTGNMGNYNQAISQRWAWLGPDIADTRQHGRTKYGIGLNFDQQLTRNLGVFGRLGWNDGQNETWCFTEADQTLSLGAVLNGAGWKRKDDNLGVAIIVNGLSAAHQQYLALGGQGFQLGDGMLNYANETVAEFYYSFKPVSAGIWLTLDYQFGLNPGYNHDRGPVNVFSVRAHVEL